MIARLIFVLLASIGFAPWAEASVIELPEAGSTKSGVDIFSGWKCMANGPITVRFDGGTPIDVPYGSERNDTISICGDADNGYALLLNYNTLGPGSHMAEVFDNGVSFASVTFTVVTTGVEFLTGVSGTGTVTLSNGQVLTVAWSEAAQGFEIVSIMTPGMTQTALTGTVNAINEIPGSDATKIGVSILSGWQCNATTVAVRFNGGAPIVVPYGSQRNDTISICGNADTGYVLLLNYSSLGAGTHTVEIFADGMLVETRTFTVITLGVEFLTGVSGTGTATLSNGVQATLQWSQAKQGVEITAFSPPGGGEMNYTGTWRALLSIDSDMCALVPPRFANVSLPASMDVTHDGSSVTLALSTPELTLTGMVASDGSFMASAPPGEQALDLSCMATAVATVDGNFSAGTMTVAFNLTEKSGSCMDFTLPCTTTMSGSLTSTDDLPPPPPTTPPTDDPPSLQVSTMSVDFEDVLVGNNVLKSIMLTNTGGGTLSGNIMLDASSEFSVESGASFSLGAGESQTIVFKFHPVMLGTISRDAAITSNGGNKTVTLMGTGISVTSGPMLSFSPSSLDFGDIPTSSAKSLTYTIMNTGDGPLTGTTQAFLEGGGSTTPLAFSLAPGASTTRTLTITAGTGTGTGSGRVEISSDGGIGIIAFTFRVVSTTPPILGISTTLITFGDSVPVGSFSERTFLVGNVGGGTLTGSVSITLDQFSEFSVVSGGSFTLGPGQSQLVRLRYAPVGPFQGFAQALVTSNGGSITIDMFGLGVE